MKIILGKRLNINIDKQNGSKVQKNRAIEIINRIMEDFNLILVSKRVRRRRGITYRGLRAKRS